MRKRVPLNAVRAFEAAARHCSLVDAADELCVTSTAISHQVRLLEDFLQVKLFIRRNSRLELTPVAVDCLANLTQALDQLDAALNKVSRAEARERLVVAASPSLTSLWLLPRLHRFVSAVPGVDVVVSALTDHAEFKSAKVDLWITGCSEDPNHQIDPLMSDEIIPVCSPMLLESACGTGRDALAVLPLIHDEKRHPRANGRVPNWGTYLAEFGIERDDSLHGLSFNQSSMAVEAAIGGYGVLLGRSQLVASALESGRLVQVYDAYSITYPYFIVSSWHSTSKAGALFRKWLKNEGAGSQPASASPTLPRVREVAVMA